jgi:hypothetical protein
MEWVKSRGLCEKKRSAQLEKISEGFGDGVQGPAPVEDLIEVPHHADPANRHLDDASLRQLVANGDARQN